MRAMLKLFAVSAATIAFAVVGHAQTVVFNGIGSSAQFLEAGLAAGSPTTSTPPGLGATCLWSQSSSAAGALEATDPTVSTNNTETGNAWVAWTIGSGGTSCSAPGAADIYVFLQTDSVIGNRCLFNGCKLGSAGTPSGSAPSNLIFSTDCTGSETSCEVPLAASVWTALNKLAVTVAATDIRPEDAKFATLRGLTSCDSAVVSGSQYLGLGYTSGGSPILSYYSNSTFHVTNFNLPTSGISVIPVGATPIVVAVNPGNASGFGATGVTNISHDELAKYLDGTYGNTDHVTNAGNSAATVLVREPLSGTYNTMEFSIPNTTTNPYGGFDEKTSQDVGDTEPAAQKNCASSGGVPITTTNIDGTSGYVMHIESADGSGGYRNRVIGTGQMVSTLLSTSNSLGYAFWSTANFENATTTTGKYLTVDGVDPLENSYGTGEIPTPGNGLLSDVTFEHLQDGTYPIWSLLRLVTLTSNPDINFVKKLASIEQGFITKTTRPDFVPFDNTTSGITNLKVFHSHFAPPGVTFSSTNVPANGTSAYNPPATDCTATEAGGDVGGAVGGVTTVLGVLPDSDLTYCANTPSTTGQTTYRQ
jgi:hypothetical protein